MDFCSREKINAIILHNYVYIAYAFMIFQNQTCCAMISSNDYVSDVAYVFLSCSVGGTTAHVVSNIPQ